MLGVVGGVRARATANGQAPIHNPDILSASTTLQQAGSGGYTRLVDALQSLDQSQNIVQLLDSIATQAAAITTLQGQVATLQGQVTTLQGQVATLQGQVTALQGQLDGWSFGAVGATVPSIAAGNVPATRAGTQYLLPLYSA